MKLTGLFSWQRICQKTKLVVILIIGIVGFVSVALPFTVIVIGDVNGDGVITDDDAWLVLQKVVDKIELSVTQQMAADVSGNGVITAYDAELILQYVAGYINHIPVATAGAGVEDIALGEIKLFIPRGLTAMPLAKGVEVPVMISGVTILGIVSLQFDVAYDTNVLTIAGVTLDGAITAGNWLVEFNQEQDSQGLVKVAMVASVNAEEGPKELTDGVIAKILFDVDSDNPNDCSDLNLENVLLNEDSFNITTGNGDICLTEPEPLKLSVVGENGEFTIDACPSDDVVLYIEASNVPISPAPEPLVRDLQFHLLYDETKLKVKSVELSDMTEERIGVEIGGHIVDLEPWAMEANIEDGVVITPGTLKVAMAQNPYAPPGYPDPPNDWAIDYLAGDGRILKIAIHVKEAIESVDVALTQVGHQYQVENLLTDDISLGIIGDVSCDGGITADDADLVLQHIVGLITLSPVQQQAADVTGNGTVSAHDASFILRWVKGIINEFPVEQIESILNATAPTPPKTLFTPLTQGNGCSDLIISEFLVNEGDIVPEIVNGLIYCPMDFSLTVEPSTIMLPIGGSASLTVTIEWIGGFTGDVELSVEGLPNGVTARQEEGTMVRVNAQNDGYPKLLGVSKRIKRSMLPSS